MSNPRNILEYVLTAVISFAVGVFVAFLVTVSVAEIKESQLVQRSQELEQVVDTLNAANSSLQKKNRQLNNSLIAASAKDAAERRSPGFVLNVI